jgi:hypothetical protein
VHGHSSLYGCPLKVVFTPLLKQRSFSVLLHLPNEPEITLLFTFIRLLELSEANSKEGSTKLT